MKLGFEGQGGYLASRYDKKGIAKLLSFNQLFRDQPFQAAIAVA
jgi:hypothetical protein